MALTLGGRRARAAPVIPFASRFPKVVHALSRRTRMVRNPGLSMLLPTLR